MTRKCRQCRWCRRFFPSKIEVKKRGCASSPWRASRMWIMARHEGVAEGLHHLHHRHFRMHEGGHVGGPFDPDLLSCKYGFRFPRVAASALLAPVRNGLRNPSDIFAAISNIFPVIIVSPRRNLSISGNNYAPGFRMFSCLQFHRCKGAGQ